MAEHKCAEPGCTTPAFGKKMFCLKSWMKIPILHRDAIRQGTEKGSHTLRARPSKEWLAKAYKYFHTKEKVAGVAETVTSSVMVVE